MELLELVFCEIGLGSAFSCQETGKTKKANARPESRRKKHVSQPLKYCTARVAPLLPVLACAIRGPCPSIGTENVAVRAGLMPLAGRRASAIEPRRHAARRVPPTCGSTAPAEAN